MNVFGNYARYYDLLYQDKDYGEEALFIQKLLQTYAPQAQTILDLGCGTGAHAMLLAKQGYQVHGVDLSQEMLQRADDRRSHLPSDLAAKLKFTLGDIRQVQLNQTFDVVLSLFHVMSYQTTNEDLLAALTTTRKHLKPGGVFLLDGWYGPAVLSDRPTTRIKRLQNESITVTRIAEPTLYPNQNLVEVHYQVLIQDRLSGALEELQEIHRMRYLFQPEIAALMQQSGLELTVCREWMTDAKPGCDTWSVYFRGQAR